NGAEALQKITASVADGKPYDLVFLDWNMPQMSGVEVLEACRAQPQYKDMLVVMVTSESEHKNVLRALKSGADDYVVKPCNPSIIKAKLEHINTRLAKKSA